MSETKKKNDLHARRIETGRRAYRMGIHISGNLYRQQPDRDLWEKGWRLERKKEDLKRNPNGHPPFRQKSDQSFEKHRHPKKFERKAPQAAPPKHEPIITDRLIARFNRRNRTV